MTPFLALWMLAAEPAPAPLPEAAAAALAAAWPGMVPATREQVRYDMVASYRSAGIKAGPVTRIEADLDGDGDLDQVVVAVDLEKRTQGLYALLQTDRGYAVSELLRVRWRSQSAQPVCLWPELKPAGKGGIAEREYFGDVGSPQKNQAERAAYRARLAVESTYPIGEPGWADLWCRAELSLNSYCSAGFTFGPDALPRQGACD